MFSNVNHTLRIVIDTRGGPSAEEFVIILMGILIAVYFILFLVKKAEKAKKEKLLEEEKNLPMKYTYGKVVDKQKEEALTVCYHYIFDCG